MKNCTKTSATIKLKKPPDISIFILNLYLFIDGKYRVTYNIFIDENKEINPKN